MIRIIKWPLFVFLLSALFVAGARAQSTYTAASCSESDVQAAINKELSTPANGDIISIPSGTCTWTGTTVISQAFNNSVTIQGAGAVSATTGGASTTGTDATVIIDNINYSGGPASMMRFTTTSGKSFRLTGMAILQNSSSSVANSAIVNIIGSSTSVRVDHCHFYMQMGSYQLRFDGPLGVVDHNFFDGINGWGGIAFHLEGSSGVGNEQWAASDQFGTSNFMYVEDSLINRSSLGDAHDGGRYVIRYCTMTSSDSTAPQMYNHGLTPSLGRSMRAAEFYQNNLSETYTNGVGQPTFANNGGTTLYWGNTVRGYREAIYVDYTRKNNATYTYPAPPSGWGYCGTANGPTNWDQNTSSSGYGCLDQPGRGAGDLLSGSFPNVLDSRTGTIAWPQQALSPIYIWANTFTPASGFSPVSLISIGDSSLLADNQDYYQQFGTYGESGSFKGTTGVGQGLYSAIPSACKAGPGGNTPGVGYWATDQNTLYVCNPTNTWTAYYTPYTYPHPLTQTDPAPVPPTNVQAVGH